MLTTKQRERLKSSLSRHLSSLDGESKSQSKLGPYVNSSPAEWLALDTTWREERSFEPGCFRGSRTRARTALL